MPPASGQELPAPSLQVAPIASAYRGASPLASLGLSMLVWTLAGGGAFLAFRVRPADTPRLMTTLPSVDLQPAALDAREEGGGGHQGFSPRPAPAVSRPRPETPLPPPVRDYSPEMPAPSLLPREPIPEVPAPSGMVVGAYGTGNGYGSGIGTGTGSGAGTGSGTGSGSGTGNGGETVVVPYSKIRFVKVVNPDYPEVARRVGLQGVAVVRVTIDENGVPFAFHVVGGDEVFVKEALRVLPRWRFTPVTHDGKKVRATFDAVLRFNLA